MGRSIFGRLSAIEQEIEEIRLLYKPDSKAFVEPLWRLRMDRLIYRRKLLLDSMGGD